MVCHDCRGQAKKHGKDRKGTQRWRCKPCGRTFSDVEQKLLGEMRLPLEKALLCLSLLVEGSSVRSIERVTGVHRDTILRLLVKVGRQCERFMAAKLRGVPVKDVQADEIWGFVSMKERTRARKAIADDRIGDAYTFVGFERHSKLVLAWHLGRRSNPHADAFVEKLERATEGHFQISTDGFSGYPDSINYHLGMRTDFAVLVKKYGYDEEQARRYSPPKIIGTDKTRMHGSPDWKRICTSHVERQNLTMRMHLRRLTRLTNGFSKKWENLRAALGLYFCWYNFCRSHSSLSGCTPAMAAGVESKPWSMVDLLEAVA